MDYSPQHLSQLATWIALGPIPASQIPWAKHFGNRADVKT